MYCICIEYVLVCICLSIQTNITGTATGSRWACKSPDNSQQNKGHTCSRTRWGQLCQPLDRGSTKWRQLEACRYLRHTRHRLPRRACQCLCHTCQQSSSGSMMMMECPGRSSRCQLRRGGRLRMRGRLRWSRRSPRHRADIGKRTEARGRSSRCLPDRGCTRPRLEFQSQSRRFPQRTPDTSQTPGAPRWWNSILPCKAGRKMTRRGTYQSNTAQHCTGCSICKLPSLKHVIIRNNGNNG